MQKNICPYLGQEDDPTTALHFPSQGNFCHHAKPVSAVNAAHQEKYCLTPDHLVCPIFQAAHPVPLPSSIAAPVSPKPVLSRKTLAAVGIPLLIAGAAAASFALNGLSSQFAAAPGFVPNSGGENLSGQSWSIFTLTQPRLPTSTPTPDIQGTANCPLPQGWVPYLVAPTDSLYRLSIIYGVSIELLQQVNCMGDATAIFPGQVIYVPLINTSTPVSSPTTMPYQPPVLVFSGGSNRHTQASPVSDTLVPPTFIPATKTPVPITNVKPTKKPPEPKVVKPKKATKPPSPKVKPTKKKR